MAGIGEFLFGSKDRIKKQQLLNKDQQAALKNYFQQGIETRPLYNAGSSYLQSLLSNSPEAFQAFQQPYLENFQQNIAPGIAERFGSVGTGAGGTQSSAFANSLAQAGRGLQSDLAALRGNMQLGSLGQALGYAQQPISNTLAGLGVQPFQYTNRPGTNGFASPILGAIGGAAAGPFGAMFGSSLGNSLFGNQRQPPSLGMGGIGSLGGGLGGFGMGSNGFNAFGFGR